ncbi:hypothetical protein LPB142_04050 [Rhodobacter xanthinilyticus]|uniref:DNA primase/polymerase bifunctional N-terminal domain-containing protein n=1 Tax=Rhodobacter xanthinilyticus TaxID=1850250 RepID=A0A1D9M9U2_9RHOB|nr:bifunctional DNA primase/polymerase [Rhodobacter xanthinilyticus]AOZ68591.1 hypothetical protein LPB142_04050 [Rhodobacter xanthinilyticus]
MTTAFNFTDEILAALEAVEDVDDGVEPSREISRKVVQKPKIPEDRLPLPPGVGAFGLPPKASLYHTERAENARQRAAVEVSDQLDFARETLIRAGLKRVHVDIPDAADHNVMTLAYALRYAECDLHVADAYAIHPVTGRGMSIAGDAKSPLGAGWQSRASSDPDQIVAFWTGKGRYPPSKNADKGRLYKHVNFVRNVSIVLPEGCGLFVLDLDGESGAAALAELVARHGELPPTPHSISGSGGAHYIFRSSRTIRNTASKIAPGVDIRGEGGQIIAAPSIHHTGNFYRWAAGRAPWECEIADAPEWLEDLAYAAMKETTARVKKERRAERVALGNGTATGFGFEAWCELIGDGDGKRGFDDTINRAACSWWRENPDGDETELIETLRDVILAAPCKDDRVERRYATDDYLIDRVVRAREYIEDRRAAEEEAAREEEAAIEAARAILRQHLVTADGKTTIAADAAQVAISKLVDDGIDAEDAEAFVAEAAEDVIRQLEERVRDRQVDPVKEESKESILAPLYDERLVDADGFMVRPADSPKLYKHYGIDPKMNNAEAVMRTTIRDQIVANLNRRASYVVIDGEAKWAIRSGRGEPVRLWKEATLGKLYINRGVTYWEGEGEKAKSKTIKPAEVFVYTRQRATYFDTCFEPDPVKAKAAEARGAYNLWTGFAVLPKPGDWSLLRDHIRDQLCGGDKNLFNWVMTWLASLFARPGVKIPSAIAVQGEQGTGKSKVFDWVRRAIGASAIKISNGRHLTGNFNAHMDGKIFMVCEESFWGGAKSDAGVIKDLISSDTLQIEGKFANVVERPNYVNLVFISNDEWMIPTDAEDARRFLVLTCLPTRKQDAAFFGAIDDQMENGGLEAMVHELTNWNPEAVDLTWDSLRSPIVTEGLRQQVGMGLRGPMARLAAILESGELAGRETGGAEFYYRFHEDEPTYVARSHLVSILHPETEKGNLSAEVKTAMAKLLGPEANGGDNKRLITYFGGYRRDAGQDADALCRDDQFDVIDLRVPLQKKDRYVKIPALKDVQETLAAFGRG